MGMFDRVAGWFGSSPSGARETEIVTHVVDLVDAQLRSVAAYQDRLLPAIDQAVAYCDRLAAAIPGPVDMTAASHAVDPRVQALFPEAAEIGVALGRSLAVKESLPHFTPEHGDGLCALLGMRRRRLAEGGDGPATIADHTFRCLGIDEGETRRRITRVAFDGLLAGFGARWKELCRSQSRAELEQRVEAELARARSADGGPSIHEEHLRQAAAQPTPEHMLEALAEWLAFPEEQLRLAGTLDIGGLALPILVGRDRRHWPVCLARVSRQAAADALARETRTHRYILI